MLISTPGFQCVGLLASDVLHQPCKYLRRFAVATRVCEEILLPVHHPHRPVHDPFPPLFVLW